MNLTKIIAHLAIIAAVMGSLAEAGNINQHASQSGVSTDDAFTKSDSATPVPATPVVTPVPTTAGPIAPDAHSATPFATPAPEAATPAPTPCLTSTPATNSAETAATPCPTKSSEKKSEKNGTPSGTAETNSIYAPVPATKSDHAEERTTTVASVQALASAVE
ncbi:hypothetical protein ON010_g10218 [Phytophthora cinnamomi]|nr:hypothetical protein ON010_g10218 [Phytophthora cinnamomi]